jgi:hypothetical protein
MSGVNNQKLCKEVEAIRGDLQGIMNMVHEVEASAKSKEEFSNFIISMIGEALSRSLHSSDENGEQEQEQEQEQQGEEFAQVNPAEEELVSLLPTIAPTPPNSPMLLTSSSSPSNSNSSFIHVEKSQPPPLSSMYVSNKTVAVNMYVDFYKQLIYNNQKDEAETFADNKKTEILDVLGIHYSNYFEEMINIAKHEVKCDEIRPSRGTNLWMVKARVINKLNRSIYNLSGSDNEDEDKVSENENGFLTPTKKRNRIETSIPDAPKKKSKIQDQKDTLEGDEFWNTQTDISDHEKFKIPINNYCFCIMCRCSLPTSNGYFFMECEHFICESDFLILIYQLADVFKAKYEETKEWIWDGIEEAGGWDFPKAYEYVKRYGLRCPKISCKESKYTSGFKNAMNHDVHSDLLKKTPSGKCMACYTPLTVENHPSRRKITFNLDKDVSHTVCSGCLVYSIRQQLSEIYIYKLKEWRKVKEIKCPCRECKKVGKRNTIPTEAMEYHLRALQSDMINFRCSRVNESEIQRLNFFKA